MTNFKKLHNNVYHVENQNGFNAALYDFCEVDETDENSYTKAEVRAKIDCFPKKYPCIIEIRDLLEQCERLQISIRKPLKTKELTQEQKLDFGIEIVSAMKASCYNWDIEEGRIDALMETEIDRMEGVDQIMWESFTDEQKERFRQHCIWEKERLHKQALYVAEIAITKYLSLINC